MRVLDAAIAAIALAPLVMPQERVSFPTEDGGIVYADVYGTGDRGVVLAHGGRFNKESWAVQAHTLATAGFRVLAAVQYLHQTGASTVSVVGASFGGGATARAAVEAPRGAIDRIVLLAHSAIDTPERMKGQKLFITSRGDTTGSGALRLPQIREQYEQAPEPKELVILDGAAHAQFIFETPQGERLMREILRFLSES
ncbi:MAG: hypothetical protein IID06_12745 [Gemmatimonadetes bacterium]|nr:hypothetical protein [Gemmatimonadota bacterium]